MFEHSQLSRADLRKLIESGEITLGGHKGLHIYGTLSCKSGKRMKVENRVFFANEQEAQDLGFRPCGNCMGEAYAKWKKDGQRFPKRDGLSEDP
ncbi:MAG: hypothetical protein KDD64_05620 [Bdellovibrionales bacterium]|nr:hypothetical protein [Bdellovibrionales bacterium]